MKWIILILIPWHSKFHDSISSFNGNHSEINSWNGGEATQNKCCFRYISVLVYQCVGRWLVSATLNCHLSQLTHYNKTQSWRKHTIWNLRGKFGFVDFPKHVKGCDKVDIIPNAEFTSYGLKLVALRILAIHGSGKRLNAYLKWWHWHMEGRLTSAP